MSQQMISGHMVLEGPFVFDNGTIPRLEISYAVGGQPSPDGENVVFVCPPFTASPFVTDWWQGLFGDGKHFDPHSHCIVSVAPLGSTYGSTGPQSIGPDGRPYLHSLPQFTVRDLAMVNQLVLEELGITKVGYLVGASLGGMVALEMAITRPSCYERMVLIGSNATQSQYMAAYSESQRMIIELDPTWKLMSIDAGMNGLKVARSVAILSYRPYTAYHATQVGVNPITGQHRSVSYQRYKGEELAKRFNAISYHRLLGTFDSHDVGRDRAGIDAALSLVEAETVVLSLAGDQVFHESEQLVLAKGIRNCKWFRIETKYGHDGFLTETDQIAEKLTSCFSNCVYQGADK